MRERLAAYAEAGADAIGVQLTNVEDFRRIGVNAPAPLVTLWPKAQLNAFEFFQLGFRIALDPIESATSGHNGARETCCLNLKQNGTDRDYFAKQKEFAATESWYKQLGSARKQN